MDELKDSVQGASFEQKDPLVIYKVEAFALFEEFIGRVNKHVTSYLSKGTLLIEEAPRAAAPIRRPAFAQNNSAMQRAEAERKMMQQAAANAGRENSGPVTVVHDGPKVGRNDLCPCGSGKKYKNCHGAN